MSVLVKGMKMPKSCGKCWFNNSSLSCAITGSCIDRDDENRDRLDDCPIVALPDKHGRLVDADALIADLEYDVELDAKALDSMDSVGRDWETIWFDKNCKQNAIDLLRNAPTIEPERKTGKWINIREGNRADCDQCGQSGRAWMNFCFDCGADMREPEDIPMEYFESGGR